MGYGWGDKDRVAIIQRNVSCHTVCIMYSSVQHSGYEHWNILITLFNFYNLYVPLLGSRVVLSCYSLFPRLGLCLGKINMIIPVDCCQLFPGFICIVSKVQI